MSICIDFNSYNFLSQEFERSRAFLFLNEIKKKFLNSFGEHVYSALPYGMNTEFSKILAGLMVRHGILYYLRNYLAIFANQKHFSESRDIDTVSQVQGELDDLKDVMVKNIGIYK